MKNSITFFIIWLLVVGCNPFKTAQKINRQALVKRHNVRVEGYDPLASLSVGNGNFAFTTDLTGLQTFYEAYEKGIPLGTQSNWGWHTNPNTQDYKRSETLKYWDVEGRGIPYRDQFKTTPRIKDACNYFRENPHRLHLGMIGLVITDSNGNQAKLQDIKNAVHELDLWTGKIISHFEFDGEPVKVEVYCHQNQDQLAVRIQSPLIERKQIAVQWKFPVAVAVNTHAGYDFNSPEKHQSVLNTISKHKVIIDRKLDNDTYQVAIEWQTDARIEETAAHQFVLHALKGDSLEFGCIFAPSAENKKIVDFAATKANNEKEWSRYWMHGGVIDFSACTDPRAFELERRVVLSQYLVKTQSSGSLPPAETGLTYNSWYGKYHMEMHWWHIAHFAQWERPEYMEEQLNYYNVLYDNARATATEQGYEGVRWQKMVGPDNENSPSSVGSYLIWQQPHIIWFAEQMYRANPTTEILNKYQKLVFATADFMSDFARWNPDKQQYDLAPPLIPAQEHWHKEITYNPPYELAYWYWGLTVAQEWKKRLGQNHNEKWEDVRLRLASPDQANGYYWGIQGATESYIDDDCMKDHPIVLGAYGILPEWNKIDPEAMRKTMHLIAERWNWETTWGWDYPMAAMTATRLNEPEMALDFLLKDVQKNTYLKNGHNYQSERLRVYLPGNGGLLTAVAMMCAGWEDCSTKNPGFPKDGKWNVMWENLKPMF